jgi:hypothetical protein
MSDMSLQPSAVAADTEGNHPAIESRPAHTEKILRDDIGWLERRIAELEAADSATERRLARCYEKLLCQRRRQLACMDGDSPGCWQDYFC